MSDIAQFLQGKTLLITGATGFLGKALVEKLLRATPDVARIYLFMRPRSRSNGVVIPVEQRLDREVIGSSVFNRLRTELGDAFEPLVRDKLVPVSGDLAHDRLGIEPDVYEQLTREVDILINPAATVVFDEPIDRALVQNTLGPQRVLELAKACKDAILVHVSTAYVSGQQVGEIEEITLPPDRSVSQLMGNGRSGEFSLEAEIDTIQRFAQQTELDSREPELTKTLERKLSKQDRGKRVTPYRREHQLEALRQRWMYKRLADEGMRRSRELGWHDSYTLTKAMGEQLLAKNRGDLPVAIVRPSIIESSLQDPEPGWVEDLKVADPLIVHYGKGRLRDFHISPAIVIDIIPVDIVANTIIAVLPHVRESGEVKVYNAASGSVNPLIAGRLVDLVHDYFSRHPMRDRRGRAIKVRTWKYPSPKRFRRSVKFRYQLPLDILMWAMDNVPLIPWSPRLRRKASVMEATLERVLALSHIYETYTAVDCRFDTSNTRRVLESLTPEDRERFNFDVTTIDWRTYIQDIHIPGLKRHVLKEGNGQQDGNGKAKP
jgi:nucleoside-diphosphate-sugar epimerase